MNTGRLFADAPLEAWEKVRIPWTNAEPHMKNGIFISHQQNDQKKAVEIGKEIFNAIKVPCYVDVLDPNLRGDSAELVAYIQNIIRRCKSLLAVVSSNTRNSWWVPLEIGIGLEGRKHIGTYKTDQTELPSYLWSWPTMTNAKEAVEWVNATFRYLIPEHLHGAWRESNPRQFNDRTNLFRIL